MLSRDPIYGFYHSNTLDNPNEYHKHYQDAETVNWTDKRLKRITRLRLLSDAGFPVWDVSYCHGVLKDDSPCVVELPFYQIPKRGFKAYIIKAANRDKVFAKGLGLLNEETYSKLL